MYRSALRSTPRAAHALRQSALRTAPRRFASTSPADKKRSWKSTALRSGLAVGAVYWYSTSSVFSEEAQPQTIDPPRQFSDDDLPTIEAVVEQKRQEAKARLAAKAATAAAQKEVASPPPVATAAPELPPAQDDEAGTPAAKPAPESAVVGGPEELEAEADSQGAFNPETGEINWDCPCLGGMAHGPCGEEFKAAFSCFVYSKEEPKGMDCIDKFQHMQNCFREHPDVYGEELADDDDDDVPEDAAPEKGAAAAKTTPAEGAAPATSSKSKDEAKSVVPAKESAPSSTVEQKVPAKDPTREA